MLADCSICLLRRGFEEIFEIGQRHRGFCCSPGASHPGKCYLPNRPRPNRWRSCLRTFAGSLNFGCWIATAATEEAMLAFTGDARKAWISPACGPASTVAIPDICPLELILLAI